MKKIIKSLLTVSLAIAMVVTALPMYTIESHAAETFTVDADSSTHTEEGTDITITGITVPSDATTVILPGKITVTGESYNAIYTSEAFDSIGAKAITVQQGATISGLGTNPTYTSISFQTGVKGDLSTLKFNNSNLMTVNDLKNVSTGTSDDITITDLFKGCTKLETIDLDFTGVANKVIFDGSFNDLSGTKYINISNMKINYIKKSFTGLAEDATVTFNNCTFENSERSALSTAFTDFQGTVKFENCTDVNISEMFEGSNMPGKTVTVECPSTGVAMDMFNNAVYEQVNLNDVIQENTTSINGMFSEAKINYVQGISTWKIGQTSITGIFRDATFGSESNTKATIKQFKALDLSKVSTADRAFDTASAGTTDYSGAKLTSLSSLKLSNITPEKFYAPDSTAILEGITEAYYVDKKADLNGQALGVLTGKSGITGYTKDTLYYTTAGTLKLVDVTANKTDTYKVLNGTKLLACVDNSVDYFSDKAGKTKADLTVAFVDSNEITLYYNIPVDKTGTIDAGAGYKVNDGTPIEEVTATLSDGTEVKLDNTHDVKFTITKTTTPSSFKDWADYLTDFKDIVFYDISITVDGKEVKSVDKQIYYYIPVPDDCTSSSQQFKVFHYKNGTAKYPEELGAAYASAYNGIGFTTDSFSPFALLYNKPTTKDVELTVNWDDAGYESNRPTSGVWLSTSAKYTDGSTENKDTAYNLSQGGTDQKITVTKTFDDESIRRKFDSVKIDLYYSTQTTQAAFLGKYDVVRVSDTEITLKYKAPTVSTIRSSFGVKFTGDDTDKTHRPATIDLPVTCVYEDNSKEDKTVTINIGTDGTGTAEVAFADHNEAGSPYDSIEWKWPEVSYYTQTGSGKTATYTYTGQSSTDKTDYKLTVNFIGDTNNVTSRPSTVTIPYTAYYNSGAEKVAGSALCIVSGATSTVTVSIPKQNNGLNLYYVDWNPMSIPGYTLSKDGLVFNYTYSSSSGGGSTGTEGNTTVTVKFSDESNKAGRRPTSLTITLVDQDNESNTVATTLKIENNTTTTTESYTVKATVPTGKTYKIKSVAELPTGYKAEYNGLTATLTYTPETVEKTFTVAWEGDAESVRPSSVSITVKSGDTTAATLTASKDTNWKVSTKLSKYLKGVEASYSITASDITNYSKSVSGDTITFKYTGTLTDAQKAEAAKANSTSLTDKLNGVDGESSLYDFEMFDWIDYANKYPDLKKAFGYNKEALYAHYIHYGLAEHRTATFTGKYENVNEEILAAYFPNDYKYKTSAASAGKYDDMLNGSTDTTTTSGNSATSNTVEKDNGDGTKTLITKNANGTTTETVVDGDGNVVSTKTYATGDTRLDSVGIIFMLIMFTSLLIAGYMIFVIKKDKKQSLAILSHIDTL